MKHNKILFLFVCLLLCLKTFAQSLGPDGKQNLSGKWTASCPMEYMNQSSVQHCQLCPFVIDTKDKSKASMKDVEITFQNDSIKLNRNGELTTLFYTQNKDTHSFRFNLKQREYKFRVFYGDPGSIVLEDDQGLVVMLKRN